MFGVVAQQRGLGRRRLFSGRQTCFPWLGPAAKLRCRSGNVSGWRWWVWQIDARASLVACARLPVVPLLEWPPQELVVAT